MYNFNYEHKMECNGNLQRYLPNMLEIVLSNKEPNIF